MILYVADLAVQHHPPPAWRGCETCGEFLVIEVLL